MTNKEKKICTTAQTACGSSDCRTFFPDGKFQEPVEKRSLLLHSCCGPCSTAVVERLAEEFNVTVFFYNPNISEESEYQKRKEELKRFLQTAPFGKEIHMQDADYEPELFEKMAKGHENDPERGPRCAKCFRLRLEETAKYAKEGTYDYFCTTLSISPHKNADLLMQIGEELSKNYGVYYLPSDFKKKNGYKRSIELSREYDLYRQDFCGCRFSKKEKEDMRCE